MMGSFARAGALITVVLLSIGCAPEAPPPPPEEPSLAAAENSYFQFELTAAERLFEQVMNDASLPPEDRVSAGRQLARIAAQLYEDLERARAISAETLALATDRSAVLTALSRSERELGAYAAAMATASQARAQAATPLEAQRADTAFAHAALEQAKADLFRGATITNSALLTDALERAESVVAEQTGLLQPSLVLLQLAVLQQRGAAALTAWHSYFHISPDSAANTVLREPAADLRRVLPEWSGQTLDAKGLGTLVRAFAGSRMFETAALLASAHAELLPADPEIARIVAYAEFLRAARTLTDAFYRASATGGGDEAAYNTALAELGESLWPALHDGPTPPFTRDGLEAAIGEAFGAELSFKRLAGVHSLHLGHRVADELLPVEQYGEVAQLNFISLDFMVSNGYTSWFWDGRASVGGWADNPTITQVRSAYANGGITAWNSITDAKSRARTEEEIERHRDTDIDLARSGKPVYLPGLARRLEFREHQRLLAELEQQGLQGAPLRLAFIEAIERLDLEASIIAHEGRHAIDATHFFHFLRSPEELEYRAKLSEIAYSSRPALALTGGILTPNIGDDTPHGQANVRVLEDLVDWMKIHRERIEGYDSALPMLPQLDLLSDDQLQDAVRSVDPMAG